MPSSSPDECSIPLAFLRLLPKRSIVLKIFPFGRTGMTSFHTQLPAYIVPVLAKLTVWLAIAFSLHISSSISLIRCPPLSLSYQPVLLACRPIFPLRYPLGSTCSVLSLLPRHLFFPVSNDIHQQCIRVVFRESI